MEVAKNDHFASVIHIRDAATWHFGCPITKYVEAINKVQRHQDTATLTFYYHNYGTRLITLRKFTGPNRFNLLQKTSLIDFERVQVLLQWWECISQRRQTFNSDSSNWINRCGTTNTTRAAKDSRQPTKKEQRGDRDNIDQRRWQDIHIPSEEKYQNWKKITSSSIYYFLFSNTFNPIVTFISIY